MASLTTKIRTRSYRLWKEANHRFLRRSNGQSTVVFILGCQRSGTTLMDDIFDADSNVKVYREVSKLSSFAPIEDGLRRLKPLVLVDHALRRDRAPIIVLKPLVESQQGDHILSFFPRAKVIWMYRHFLDVASSNLAHFGKQNGINNLRPLAMREYSNWRAERVSGEVQTIVSRYWSESMEPFDAATLFWYVRNSLFYDLKMNEHRRVMMLNYETLVTNPPLAMQRVYQFLGHDFPGNHIVATVNSSSLGKGRSVPVSPEILSLAGEMLSRLDASFSGQTHFSPGERRLSSEVSRKQANP